MNFLQLAQEVARESGTVPGEGRPATVAGQTGRLGDIVRWTKQAWTDIQNYRSGWLWMMDEWEGDTVATQQRYTPVEMGIASRFAEWHYTDNDNNSVTSIYLKTAGVSDVGSLVYVPFTDFYTNYIARPEPTNGRPRVYSTDSQQRLVLSATPDGIYTLRGLYRKSVQVLAGDSDTPEMPERFHSIIVDKALIYLGTNDESQAQLPMWDLRLRAKMSELERDQLPRANLAISPIA
jgi:hypothetical protein